AAPATDDAPAPGVAALMEMLVASTAPLTREMVRPPLPMVTLSTAPSCSKGTPPSATANSEAGPTPGREESTFKNWLSPLPTAAVATITRTRVLSAPIQDARGGPPSRPAASEAPADTSSEQARSFSTPSLSREQAPQPGQGSVRVVRHGLPPPVMSGHRS